MKLSSWMLDLPINEFEEVVTHNMTYREYIRDWEDFLEIENADLDSMTDEELDKYDSWIFEMSLK